MIRCLVVDDARAFRAVLRHILASAPGVEVIGEASDGREAVALVRTLRPDVVTMDVRMPHLDGLEALEEIMRVAPTPVVVVSGEAGDAAQPLSLSFRLFGNIMAKEVLLGILAFLVVFLYSAGGVVDTVMTIVPLLLRPLIILLGLLVGFIQAFIFTLLSIVYVGGAVKTHSERSH